MSDANTGATSYGIFSHSLRTVTANIGVAFAIFWPWALVGLALMAAGLAVFGLPDFANLKNQGLENQRAMANLDMMHLLGNIVQIIVGSSIAVNWHRFVLLDEIPQTLAERLRIDRLVLRYAGNTILIVLLFFAVAFMAMALTVFVIMAGFSVTPAEPPSPGSIMLMVLGGLVLMVFLTTVMMRMMVKLPAVALGRSDYGIRQALADTRGSSLTILGMVILTILLSFGVMLAAVMAVAFIASISPVAAMLLAISAYMVFVWFFTIFTVSQLTTLYGVYAEGREV